MFDPEILRLIQLAKTQVRDALAMLTRAEELAQELHGRAAVQARADSSVRKVVDRKIARG